jgi:hypothetical protein
MAPDNRQFVRSLECNGEWILPVHKFCYKCARKLWGDEVVKPQ